MFCPTCHVLTYPPRPAGTAPVSAMGDIFECTIWQGPNRARGIEIPVHERDRYFSRKHEEVVLQIDGKRTVAKLGASFWKKPAVIKKSVDDAGRDQLLKFFEKHHLLPPQQSMKEKGIVDTVIFEVVSPTEEFKLSLTEKTQDDESGQENS